jgi:hypothetical protein
MSAENGVFISKINNAQVYSHWTVSVLKSLCSVTLPCLLNDVPCISVTNARMTRDKKIAFEWQ